MYWVISMVSAGSVIGGNQGNIKMPERDINYVDDFEEVIKKHGLGKDSSIPSHLLALYLADCVDMYTEAVQARDKWFGVDVKSLL